MKQRLEDAGGGGGDCGGEVDPEYAYTFCVFLDPSRNPNRDFLGAKICLIELQFSYTTRRVTTDRLHCVNESHSLPTPLAFTVGVSLPWAVLVKRPGGVFNLPVF